MACVGFADHIHIALSTDYLAVTTHFLDRRLYFHRNCYFSLNRVFCLETLNDTGFAAIWLKLQAYPISYKDADTMKAHLARKVGKDGFLFPIDLDAEHDVWESFDNGAGALEIFVCGHVGGFYTENALFQSIFLNGDV